MKWWNVGCLVAALAVALVVGCSDGNGFINGGENGLEISLFDTLSVQGSGDLPSCDGAREGRAFFVRNDNIAYFCVNGVWRKASDSTDFSITCSDGFLHAVGKIAHEPEPMLDTVRLAGLAGSSLSGNIQNGPFMFGTSVGIVQVNDFDFYRGTAVTEGGCVLGNDGRYRLDEVYTNTNEVKISATGYYRNIVTGRVSDSPVTLSALSQVAGSIEANDLVVPNQQLRGSININVLTHLEIPRIEQLAMNHIEFGAAKAQAEREIFAAFGIDTVHLYSQNYWTDGRTDKPAAEDMELVGNSEYSAALLAIAAMLQGDRNEADMMNLINNLAEDIKGDGVWNDPNWKIKIADWVVGMDSSWKYNDIRNNVSAWGVGPVPNFEKYMRAFFPIAYGFEPCGAANAGTVTYVNQGQSVYFANDYEHADHSKVRFICDENGFQWRVANAIERDTAGFGPGEYDREVREGRVDHDSYYIFDAGKWRVATPQEADGFTDIADVYANLKSSDKVVFIIRHSERTNDTGPSGHLTDNGKKYARDLGTRLAKVGTEDFYYGYSGYTRTYETCENIAQGKGQAVYSIDSLYYLDGSWYVMNATRATSYVDSDGGGWVVYSKYAFAGEYTDAFYDLETRSEQLLKDEILANIASMKRVNFMCTHDYLVVPLLAYTTDGHANVRYYEKYRWVNYLAGVAMIISADGSVRYIPVKGLESGTM